MKAIKRFIVPVLVVYILWWVGALFVNKPMLPVPHKAIIQFFIIFPTQLWVHMLVSLYRVVSGIGIALMIGLPFGLFIGRNREMDRFISPIIYLLHPVPKIAFLPIIMLLFGLGDIAKILTVALIVFFLILITARDAGKNIDRQLYYSLIAMGASELQIYRHVIIPAAMPAIFTILRLSIGTAIAVLFFSETFATSYGVGFFIIDAWTRIVYDEMVAGIIGLSFIGLILYGIVDVLEKKLCKWKGD
ncbi:MAG: NitT/TauT family transport system permease protein [Clostridiales bacterium]|jgi:NitT/TauT family transport system permease protein|nr:NitT/TauT family transport system permease protein [Clostridiales bacterium]MDK2933788.1 NitT/TauT family transport system permease protein [Clostridiales bacterium]